MAEVLLAPDMARVRHCTRPAGRQRQPVIVEFATHSTTHTAPGATTHTLVSWACASYLTRRWT